MREGLIEGCGTAGSQHVDNRLFGNAVALLHRLGIRSECNRPCAMCPNVCSRPGLNRRRHRFAPCLQHKRIHRNQLPIDGIDSQAEYLQSDRAEQRLRVLIPEHDGRNRFATVKPHPGAPEASPDAAAVRENESPRAVGRYPQSFEDGGGQYCISRPGIHHGLDGFIAVACGIGHVKRHGKNAHEFMPPSRCEGKAPDIVAHRMPPPYRRFTEQFDRKLTSFPPCWTKKRTRQTHPG